MAFSVAIGVDVVASTVVLGTTLMPKSQHATVKIGCGSRARDELGGSTQGGGRPDLVLYDTHGVEFARSVGGEPFDPGSNPIIDMGVDLLDPAKATKTPEYIKIVPRGSDAVCVSYVAVSSSAEDVRVWHAGYAKPCALMYNANFWYPSPEVLPTTDLRPGCIWMSSDTRFVQAISVKLTDFAFPTDDAAHKASEQFELSPETLCQAPGRQTFWKTAYQKDCIPFYDFTVEKNETTGFDLDSQRIIDGHTLPCTPLGTAFGQTLEPGKGPKPPSVDELLRKKKEAEELARQAQEQAERAKQEAEKQEAEKQERERKERERQEELRRQQEENEQGRNPNSPPPGAGGFGGICGVGLPGSNATAGQYLTGTGDCPGAVPSPVPSGVGDISRRRRRRGSSDRRHPPLEKDHCVDRLVVSHLDGHSAREVCEMESSWGPDFVSIPERLYCNMCTRELLGLCGFDGLEEEGGDCFDLERRVPRRALGLRVGARGEDWTGDQGVKVYAHVEEWKVEVGL